MAGVVLMLMVAGLLEGFGRQLITNDWARWGVALTTALLWGFYFYGPVDAARCTRRTRMSTVAPVAPTSVSPAAS